MKEKGMSKGEFTSVAQANGGLENNDQPELQGQRSSRPDQIHRRRR